MENNTQVAEPMAEPSIDSFAAPSEPAVDPVEPVGDPVEPVPATDSEPAVDPVPATDSEPSADPEPTPVDPEPNPVPTEPTIEEQYTALQAAHEDLQARFVALENEKAELQNQLSTLQTAHDGLVEFKRQIDDAKKDEMIEKFYMLSDEDKQDVIANKANYSVEDIEEKLSVICFRKKVIFDLDNSPKNDNITEPPVVYSYNNVSDNEPAWITAVKNNKKNRI